MAPSRRDTPPCPAVPLRQRVNHCFTKLADRDTEAMAASELDSLALSLPPDSFPPFLSAISDSRPSDKTPLRRHSLRLLSLLSRSHPPTALLPHLPRMLSVALRRLRDPDSSVRGACVDAVRAMAAANPGAVPETLLNPLGEPLLHEQDLNAQAASALCLAAAVDAAADSCPDLALHLQRLVPRLVKLAKSNAFKAKPALLSLLGSIAGAGGASTGNLLGVLVPCLVQFLSSEDWAARKAAAEALSCVALSEKERLGGFKSSCLSSFESRRFDKVKIVRDTMNHMVEVWKDIPVAVEDCSNAADSQSKSTRETTSEGHNIAGSRRRASVQSASSPIVEKKKTVPSRSPPPDASPIATVRKTTPTTGKKQRPRFPHRMKDSDWGTEVADSHVVRSKLDARRVLFDKPREGEVDKLFRMKSASYEGEGQETASSKPTVEVDNATNELHAKQNDTDLSLIRMQLVQIENQQSNLLELIQRFIGSSQSGLNSLETRVHGLELALDGISHDLAVSSGRLPRNDSSAKTCCRLPGAEFLSSKFWRTEGRYTSKLSSPSNPKLDVQHFAENKSFKSGKLEKRRLGLQGNFVVNPLAEIKSQARGIDITPDKTLIAIGTRRTQVGSRQQETSKIQW